MHLGGFNSYVAIQNAGDSRRDRQRQVSEFQRRSAGHGFAVQIEANASHVFYQDDGKLPGSFIGSAIFEAADGSTPLAGAVALYNKNSAQLAELQHLFSTAATRRSCPAWPRTCLVWVTPPVGRARTSVPATRTCP